MTKAVIHLPDFFTNGSSAEFFIHFYSADQDSIKDKIIYSQNMIGFLQWGTKKVYSLQNSAAIDNTNILLLNSGSVLMSQSLAEQNIFKSVLLFFSSKFISEFILKYAIEISNSGTTKNTDLFTLPKDTFLQNFENSLLLLKQVSSPDLQKIKIEELLLYLLTSYPRQTTLFLQNVIHKTSHIKIQQVVNDHIDKGLGIEELAFLCNMSISTFKRHFIENFNTSPKKYFTDYRMNQAKQFLQMNKRASEIYADLGYESLSAFSNEFKKHFGLSPKHFQSKNELLEK